MGIFHIYLKRKEYCISSISCACCWSIQAYLHLNRPQVHSDRVWLPLYPFWIFFYENFNYECEVRGASPGSVSTRNEICGHPPGNSPAQTPSYLLSSYLSCCEGSSKCSFHFHTTCFMLTRFRESINLAIFSSKAHFSPLLSICASC